MRALALALLLCAGCSAANGEPTASESEPIAPGCTASSLACDGSWLSAQALAGANWTSLQCPANVNPDVPAVGIFGCMGTWIGQYSPSANWHWCCPSAK